MKRNFKLIGGFWVAQKEIEKRKLVVKDIIDRFYWAGIREFFVWYNPPYWHDIFGFEVSPNWRFGENEQITSYETLKEAVDYIHTLKTDDGHPCELYLTVNFRYYSDVTFPLVQRIIDDVLRAGVDGIIVWAPEILEYLAAIKFPWRIHLSTILSIFNEDTIEFYRDYMQENNLDLHRIILPRELTPTEIQRITQKFPELKFEVFGHWDYCRYSNWLCLAEHKYFSRDLCGFVLKQWLEVRRTVVPNFKQIILSETIGEQQKQQELDNRLRDISYTFVAQTVVDANSSPTLLDEFIQDFQNNFDDEKSTEEIKDLAKKLYKLIWKELRNNFEKYIYDWLRPQNDYHNQIIEKTLLLHRLFSIYIERKDPVVEEKVELIKAIRKKAKEAFEASKNEKWQFGVESYYKFMLYNRTSVPFYAFFNDINNIKVIKIPLRGRDMSVMNLWLETIDKALSDPTEFIDYQNLSWKYFHYDPSILGKYKELVNG